MTAKQRISQQSIVLVSIVVKFDNYVFPPFETMYNNRLHVKRRIDCFAWNEMEERPTVRRRSDHSGTLSLDRVSERTLATRPLARAFMADHWPGTRKRENEERKKRKKKERRGRGEENHQRPAIPIPSRLASESKVATIDHRPAGVLPVARCSPRLGDLGVVSLRWVLMVQIIIYPQNHQHSNNPTAWQPNSPTLNGQLLLAGSVYTGSVIEEYHNFICLEHKQCCRFRMMGPLHILLL